MKNKDLKDEFVEAGLGAGWREHDPRHSWGEQRPDQETDLPSEDGGVRNLRGWRGIEGAHV